MRRYRALAPGFASGGDEPILPEDESHHLLRVLRLVTGAEVDVFDGAGREWATILTGTEGRQARVRILQERTDVVEPPLRIVLMQALCKFDRMEQVLQKGTEIGVSVFHPVRTVRAEALRLSPNRLARWQRIVREAAKQCGRRVVPQILPVSEIPDGAPPGGVGILPTPGAPVGALEHLLEAPTPAECGVLIGPEGGLDSAEVTAVVDAGWTSVGLGPRVFRAETAGIVAASIVLHSWGDLGARARG